MERGRGGKREREKWGRPPALLPPTGFCLKYHPEGAHLTKPGWSKPRTHSNPTNLALFRHKITLYRFNQGGSYYCRGLKWEQGAERPTSPLTLTTEFVMALLTPKHAPVHVCNHAECHRSWSNGTSVLYVGNSGPSCPPFKVTQGHRN